MDQHPVPQNISSYEFRLVGDMTLKQFFQLAGGVLAAIIIYRFPLIGLLKWPLMGLSVLIGVLLAFVPVNGRPFSQWVMAFIRAIYSPTEFAWSSPPPSPLPARNASHSDAGGQPQNPPPTVNPPPSKPPTPLDILESQLFSKFSTLFQQIHPILTSPSPQPQKPPSTFHLPPSKPTPPPVPKALPAVFAPGLPSPSYPNLLSGMVTDSLGKILEGVILEITDTTGLPVRALRSNKLGQFLTATPLPNGTHIMTAEKEGLFFDPISIITKGEIVPPIIISAQQHAKSSP